VYARSIKKRKQKGLRREGKDAYVDGERPSNSVSYSIRDQRNEKQRARGKGNLVACGKKEEERRGASSKKLWEGKKKRRVI